MTQFTAQQTVSKPRSLIQVTEVSLWERKLLRDQNSTFYNYSKNKSDLSVKGPESVQI